MKIGKKLKILDENNIFYSYDHDLEVAKIDLKKSNLLFRDCVNGTIKKTDTVDCYIYSKKEYIKHRTWKKIYVDFYGYEPESRKSFRLVNDILDAFVPITKKQYKVEQLLTIRKLKSRKWTNKCLTTMDRTELIANKLYLEIC